MLFVLRIFLSEISRVLSEIVALHVLLALCLDVVFFLLLHGLFKSDFLELELLHLFLFLLLLLCNSICLAPIYR